MVLSLIKKAIFSPLSLLFSKSTALPQNPKKILIIRSGAIGDVLMTTPLVAGIRQKWPKPTEIHYLTGIWSKGVLANNPNIDKVITFRDEIVVNKSFGDVWKLAAQLQKEHYDLCFILDKSWLWNMFAQRSGCEFRIGFNRGSEGFPNTLSVPFHAEKHELEYYADIAQAVGITPAYSMEIFPTVDDEVKGANMLTKIGAAHIIGIAPGGAQNPGQSLLSKRWPKQNYAIVLEKLVKNDRNLIIFFGGKGDKFLCEALIDTVSGEFPLEHRVAARKRMLNLCGELSAQQSYLLMQHLDLFLTNDSGAMHIAAAAGLARRMVALFGPTDPVRFAPKDAHVLAPKNMFLAHKSEDGVYQSSSEDVIDYATPQDALREIRRIDSTLF